VTSFQMIFSFCLIFGVISLVVGFFIRVPAIEMPPSSAEPETNGFKLSNFIEPNALPIAVITMIIGVGYSSILSFINFYAIEINLVETASYFFVVYAIAVL